MTLNIETSNETTSSIVLMPRPRLESEFPQSPEGDVSFADMRRAHDDRAAITERMRRSYALSERVCLHVAWVAPWQPGEVSLTLSGPEGSFMDVAALTAQELMRLIELKGTIAQWQDGALTFLPPSTWKSPMAYVNQ